MISLECIFLTFFLPFSYLIVTSWKPHRNLMVTSFYTQVIDQPTITEWSINYLKKIFYDLLRFFF